MRYPADHKAKTKGRILDAAGRSFRKQGFSMTGVDGVAEGAGVTSGAFYGHFRSKAEVFRAALSAGLGDLRQGIEACQAKFGAEWVEALAEFYFTTRVNCDLSEGCALPSLSADVARGDAKTKGTFEKEFLSIVSTLAKGLPGTNDERREARAIVMAALFAGGVTVARSVRDKQLRDRIARVLRSAVVTCARQD